MKDVQKRALQVVVAVCCLVPLLAGGAGMIMGPAMVDPVAAFSRGLDSHFRYLSGLLFGIGIAYASTIPQIETKGRRFRLLTGIVLIGGIGRLLSVIVIGSPSGSMIAALAMELLVTPSLALWQLQVERRA